MNELEESLDYYKYECENFMIDNNIEEVLITSAHRDFIDEHKKELSKKQLNELIILDKKMIGLYEEIRDTKYETVSAIKLIVEKYALKTILEYETKKAV